MGAMSPQQINQAEHNAARSMRKLTKVTLFVVGEVSH